MARPSPDRFCPSPAGAGFGASAWAAAGAARRARQKRSGYRSQRARRDLGGLTVGRTRGLWLALVIVRHGFDSRRSDGWLFRRASRLLRGGRARRRADVGVTWLPTIEHAFQASQLTETVTLSVSRCPGNGKCHRFTHAAHVTACAGPRQRRGCCRPRSCAGRGPASVRPVPGCRPGVQPDLGMPFFARSSITVRRWPAPGTSKPCHRSGTSRRTCRP